MVCYLGRIPPYSRKSLLLNDKLTLGDRLALRARAAHRTAEFGSDVLPLDEACFLQTLAKRGHELR